MTEKEIRQALAKAEGEFIDRMVDVFRRAMTEAYMKGLMDGANLEHDDDAAEKRLAEEAEVLASGQEPLRINLDAKDDGGPLVKLKPEAWLRCRIKAGDFCGCRNMVRILNHLSAHRIETYGDLARLTAADVWAWHRFGKKSFEELQQVMKMKNVEFRKV